MATDAVQGTAYRTDNIEKICSKNETITLTGSSSIAMEENGTAATYMINVNAGKRSIEKNHENPCVTVRQRDIPPMSEAYLYARTGVRGV